MTRQQLKEIRITLNSFVKEPDGLEKLYKTLNGTMKGFRSYMRNACIEYWNDFDPYYDRPWLDCSSIKIDDKWINCDDLYCLIRDNLKDDIHEKMKVII